MTRTNERRNDINRDYYEYRRNAYDQHYGNVYYIDQPPLPSPYYTQLQPPYYYAAQDSGRSASPLNADIPPLRNSFYAERPVVRVSGFEESRVSRNGVRVEKKKNKDSWKEKGTQRVIKEVKPRDKQKLSVLRKISNGITQRLETFFYK